MKNALRNGTLFGAGVIVALILFFAITNFSTATTSKSYQNTNTYQQPPSYGDVQVASVKVEGSTYVLSPSEFKAGSLVKLEFDMSTLYGCSRTIVIQEFGVRKNLKEDDNIIEFTPNKAGTFNIACSMNMYRGTFTVLQSDGTKSDYVQTPAPATGGCGCGGGAKGGGADTCGGAI